MEDLRELMFRKTAIECAPLAARLVGRSQALLSIANAGAAPDKPGG